MTNLPTYMLSWADFYINLKEEKSGDKYALRINFGEFYLPFPPGPKSRVAKLLCLIFSDNNQGLTLEELVTKTGWKRKKVLKYLTRGQEDYKVIQMVEGKYVGIKEHTGNLLG